MDRPLFTRTLARPAHLETPFASEITAQELADAFLAEPFFQRGYAPRFGTRVTTEYDPAASAMTLIRPDDRWQQTFDDLNPRCRIVHCNEQPVEPVDLAATLALMRPFLPDASQGRGDTWLAANPGCATDRQTVGRFMAEGGNRLLGWARSSALRRDAPRTVPGSV